MKKYYLDPIRIYNNIKIIQFSGKHGVKVLKFSKLQEKPILLGIGYSVAIGVM